MTVSRPQSRAVQLAAMLIMATLTRAAFAADPRSLHGDRDQADRRDTGRLPASVWAAPAPHPRLLASAAKFDAIKRQIASDSMTAALAKVVIGQADDGQRESVIAYPAQGFLFGEARLSQGRILSCAMAFRLTGERRYFERARTELLALANLPDWCPGHFLDTGECALAAGVGLDWLYDTLDPADRQTISRAIVEKALRPGLEAEAGPQSWVNGNFNWNPVCHGGLTAGAIAVLEDEPQLARRVIERALDNIPFAAATYAPDGSYPEGPSYWSYGTSFYVIFVEALRSAFGTSCDFEQAPGFLRTADWVHQMVAPSGQDFNFSDYHPRHAPDPVMFWFARELHRPDVARTDLAAVTNGLRPLAAGETSQDVDPSNRSRQMALALLYWDATPPTETHIPPLPFIWTAGGHLPVAVLRSAWNYPKATYVAVKGGTPNGSHGHMDVGSFVLEADGVRWAVDLGTENYDRMRKAGIDLWNYTQSSSRWTVFRCGPEAHNLLRFDNSQQSVDGFATVTPLPGNTPSEPAGGVNLDLTSLYSGRVTAAARRVNLNADRSVTLADTWTAGPRPVATSWQWLTRATVSIKPGGATLRQAGQSMFLKIDGPADTVVTVEDLSLPKGPQDSPNPGLSRILVQCRTPALESAGFTIRTVPGSVDGR